MHDAVGNSSSAYTTEQQIAQATTAYLAGRLTGDAFKARLDRLAEEDPGVQSRMQQAEIDAAMAYAELGECDFCPAAAVMLVNGVAMCQTCGDLGRDKDEGRPRKSLEDEYRSELESWMESKHGHRD
jgi:hypothetical protein